ncbi:hypothetical protein [Escherichia coli]|uniref:hypothetical protein n=1 Tax=Escherichia coli TaxID=562 RepID=UPI00339BB686
MPDRFKNLILLIDGLSFGTFGFHPHEGFEDELILYIQKTNERVKTLFFIFYTEVKAMKIVALHYLFKQRAFDILQG